MPPVPAKKLRAELAAYGVDERHLRFFGTDRPRPELQDYLTLNSLRTRNQPSPDGVVESAGRPILYFVDEQRLAAESRRDALFETGDPSAIAPILRQLTCRAERAYLARIQSGRLLVTPVSPKDRQPTWAEYTPDSTAGKTLFSRLVTGFNQEDDFAAGDVVFERLFKLLKHVADRIARDKRLRPDALSLVGRALFLRFLHDRGVLDDYSIRRIAPGAANVRSCFSDAANSASTCAWLDATFNGDFLPLTDDGSESFFTSIGDATDGAVFRHLTAVVCGYEPAGNRYQSLLTWEWSDFDFAHIPVGLLSQVYEAFCHEWMPTEARKTSQKYTPRNIAVTMVDEVFDRLPDAASCRVLDPACGAGVFLVLAFRRLYRELWKQSGDQPDTSAIRKILERQITGFDISESALKLAALSLYLTAIELDPTPRPPHKLRFRNLRGAVLYDVRDSSESHSGPTLGSLGPEVGRAFDARFDVVVSNPPWTSLDKPLGDQFGEVYQSIIRRIDGDPTVRHELPDHNPDLPFLWKAAEWCKPGGRIAMALPARILLKTEPTPVAARKTLFRLMRVDGIINGSNLADSPVWPQMNQPWMLLFATNVRPCDGHSLQFITLQFDPILNRTSSFRIDSKSTRLIAPSVAADKPYLWKSLSIGTTLDAEVIQRILNVTAKPLGEYWAETVGPGRHGKGYQLAEGQKKLTPCDFLKDLPDLRTPDQFRYFASSDELPKFKKAKVWRPRTPSIYDPPLVLVKQAPGQNRRDGVALLAFERIAYSESFNGYSASGHPDGELLVRYLHLFVHSQVWQYYLLLTSPEFGAERRRAHKADLDAFPLVSLESLNANQRKEIAKLSRAFDQGRQIAWDEIDAFFARLYGLEEHDLQVIQDTLSVSLPFKSFRSDACRVPSKTEKTAFVGSLRKALVPFVEIVDQSLSIQLMEAADSNSPYSLLVLGGLNPSREVAYKDAPLDKICRLADETGATQIVLAESGQIVVGIYNQYRYWTQSRARLLAGDIIRNHLDAITE